METYKKNGWTTIYDTWTSYIKSNPGVSPLSTNLDMATEVELISIMINYEQIEDDFKIYNDLKELKNNIKLGYLLSASAQSPEIITKSRSLMKSIIKLENENGKNIEVKFNDLSGIFMFHLLAERCSRLVKALPEMITVLEKNDHADIAKDIKTEMENVQTYSENLKKYNPVNSEDKVDKILELFRDFYKFSHWLNDAMNKAEVKCGTTTCYSHKFNLKSPSIKASL